MPLTAWLCCRIEAGQFATLYLSEEMGRFLLGSTVVMLFPKGVPPLRGDWVPGRGVQLSEAMVCGGEETLERSVPSATQNIVRGR